MSKHLQSTPLVDVAWAVEVGLAAAGPWQERRHVTDRRAVDERRAGSMSFSGVERRVAERRANPRGVLQPIAITFGDSAQGRVLQSNVFDAARMARERAMAAFSDFKVGAALETTDGRIITGCNIENSTYGLTMCAERVAIFKALSEGHRSFTRIAIVADTDQPTSPCGACRQMLWEFAGDIEVILADLTKVKTTHQLKDLLPHPFDARFIE